MFNDSINSLKIIAVNSDIVAVVFDQKGNDNDY